MKRIEFLTLKYKLMPTDQIVKERNVIAELGGYKKITNFAPDVWDNGKRKITSLCFDKPKMFGELMEIVEYIEESKDLIIEIKRYQCSISKMHLTRNEKFIDVDGGASKQKAVFQALSKLGTMINNNTLFLNSKQQK